MEQQADNTLGLCTWPGGDPLMQVYHDTEWGKPLFDDQKLFEFMVLDAFQAGLSWRTVLYKREAFRQAFFHFDAHILARQEPSFVEEQMQNAGIIRNRAKITSTITNAQAYLRLQELHGSFSTFIWSFTNHKPIVNHHTTSSTMPSSSPESDAMSAALRGAGFKFVGTTICYAFMQAAGLVNDHLVTCPRWQEAQGLMP